MVRPCLMIPSLRAGRRLLPLGGKIAVMCWQVELRDRVLVALWLRQGLVVVAS